MFNPFVASNSVNDWESFIVECYICLFYSVIPIFQNLWGQGSWLTFLTGRFKKSGIYIPTFVTDNFQEVQKPWVWEIGLLYYLIGHVTNASFKQGVEILLMPKIDKAHKNYLKPEIWEETHLREIFCGTLIFQQSSMSCIDHHVGINWSETTLCLHLVKHLRVTLRCAVNITRYNIFSTFSLKFNRARYNSLSMSNVQIDCIWGVDWSTFRLASHFDLSHSIILKMK